MDLWVDKSYAANSVCVSSLHVGGAFVYLRWLSNLRRVVGVEWLVLGFAGTLLIENKTVRNIFIRCMARVLLLGFSLPYHISTHDYYHLPLLLFIAFGISGLFKGISPFLRANPRDYVY
jgi:hypothetical protein